MKRFYRKSFWTPVGKTGENLPSEDLGLKKVPVMGKKRVEGLFSKRGNFLSLKKGWKGNVVLFLSWPSAVS